MPDADRLPEIQDRAAKALAGSVDVDWLIGEVVRLRAETEQLSTENAIYERALGLNEEAA